MRLHTVPTLFDRWLTDSLPLAEPAASGPRFDLVEHADRFEIAVDLPGFRREDVEVEYADGALHLRGRRPAEDLPDGARVHLHERRPLRFRRGFALGDDVDVPAIEATFRDGVLRIKLPKSAKAKPREIKVS